MDVLHRPQRCLLSDHHPPGITVVSPVCGGGSGVPVSGSLLQAIHNPTGLHQGLLPDIGMDASVRCAPPPVCR